MNRFTIKLAVHEDEFDQTVKHSSSCEIRERSHFYDQAAISIASTVEAMGYDTVKLLAHSLRQALQDTGGKPEPFETTRKLDALAEAVETFLHCKEAL